MNAKEGYEDYNAWTKEKLFGDGGIVNPIKPTNPAVIKYRAQAKYDLTDDQVTTLRMVAEGYPSKTIASELFLSEAAIKSRLLRIRTKMNARSTGNAIYKATKAGMFSLLMLLTFMATGQTFTVEENAFLEFPLFQDSIGVDSTLCIERGHIMSDPVSLTLMHCPPYIVDTDSVTYRVFPNCNTGPSFCVRCGKQEIWGGKETREIIWKKSTL